MQASIGADRDACYAALCAGVSGARPLQVFHAARYGVQHAYEIDDRPAGGGDRPGRATRWLTRCVRSCMAEAAPTPGRLGRVAVLVGTGLRELRSVELWWTQGFGLSAHELHFGAALRTALPGCAPALTLCNACSASLFALGLGTDLLALDEADAVVVAGTDALTESMVGLADRANPDKPERVRPFERERRGVLLGEGAAAVLLEPVERAAARGRRPLALVRGVGLSCDAFHETAPDPLGVERAMRDAHHRAQLGPEDIDLLVAHGTGTALNDDNEVRVLRAVFGTHAGRPLITALKSMTGHTSGASGLMSVVIAVECLRHATIPPIVGLTTPLPGGEGLDFVCGRARRRHVRTAQVDAFGFGGVNAVAILEEAVA